LEEVAAAQGWDPESQVDLLLRYVRNQGSEDVLADFAADVAARENDLATATALTDQDHEADPPTTPHQ
jgi:hypothetical protein